MKRVFIVTALRTAIGNFGGSLAQTSPVQLGTACVEGCRARISSMLAEAGMPQAFPTTSPSSGSPSGSSASVDELIVGNVLGAGHGMNIARQIALGSGLPETTPAYCVNMVCGSGLKAVSLGFERIRSGEANCIIAGGVESMSQSGHVTLGARWGLKMGSGELKDLMLSDGLTDAFHNYHMGITAENLAEQFSISRAEQDAYSVESQRRAAAAQAAGAFKNEIIPVPLMKRGKPVGEFATDEFIRADTSIESLAKLNPAFRKDGTVTAGNASGLNDGAAMVVLMSEELVSRLKLTPMAEVIGFASAGVQPEVMGLGPVPAVRALCSARGIDIQSVDVVEANEAFAVQALAVARELKLDPTKVNPQGGAIALGHPIGASGARVLTTLTHELHRLKGSLGIATLCVGGGQGIAALIRRYD